ncbi:GNAT family N-acetyltransferase [uncultured Pontibacter sp.]|uniref:GNAT family N-acetyltransferase n=1 Tax=uncultured Pontibacter sp. TaxID=453356 RepID=UPI002627B1F4|nr:GNAT family N-acetyltransferase [uncultured Pontibacter sp.]
MIKILKYIDLSPAESEALEHHVTTVFGNVPFVQNHSWAQPDWSFIKLENGEVATFYNVVLREVSMDGKPYNVAGINNVITPEKYRGKGYASHILQLTQDFLYNELCPAYGLLLCADALLPFYSRLGWYKVATELYYDQPEGRQLYDSNVMLFAPAGQPKLKPQRIDLNGLPW